METARGETEVAAVEIAVGAIRYGGKENKLNFRAQSPRRQRRQGKNMELSGLIIVIAIYICAQQANCT